MNITLPKWIQWLKDLWEKWFGKPSTTTTTKSPDTSNCTCDLTKPIINPDKGQECPTPWGQDVRFLAWSPSKSDWDFIGFDPSSATYANGNITGNCFTKNGKTYHYEGQRQKSSSAQMITDRTVPCKPTHRVYYKAR